MYALIRYFASRPVIANVLMFGLIGAAVALWSKVGKEEMPEFAMEWVRVSIRYPGAAAEDVELLVTKPVEEKIKGLSGLDSVRSTSAYGSSSFSITFETGTKNLQEKIQEVKDAVNSVSLPREADDPVYRQFRSSEKAIIDIGMFLKEKEILTVSDRRLLQEYALAFKNKILSLREISGVDTSGYLRPEIHVKVHADRLSRYELSMNQVKNQILQKNIRRPLGSLRDENESDVIIVSELDDVDSLRDMIITSGFSGSQVRLGEIAHIEPGFAKTTTVNKVQGREGLTLNIKKSASTDILTAQRAVVEFIDDFTRGGSSIPVGFVLIDDESYDVRNRLTLIGTNGFIGFILIAFFLFIFLDFKSGVWVAMGIPFSLAFTLIVATILGYSINNMTLAAIIVVLGIVVDDAIIVAENIVRHRSDDPLESVTRSTLSVGSPVIASVLTTCAAFVPLYFFSGRFGLFVKYIPTIVMLMLVASLLESFLVLPAHMSQPLPFAKNFAESSGGFTRMRTLWTGRVERFYERSIAQLLRFRVVVMLGFTVLLAGSGYIFAKKMKYVMFPREESRNFRVKVIAAEGTDRLSMARKIRSVEDVFLNSPYVTSIQSRIGQSRRGGQVKENEASIRVEILAPSERDRSLNELLAEWKPKIESLPGFEKVRFQKSWWGSDSGSPIAIQVQENNDIKREEVVTRLTNKLEQLGTLTNIEVEKPLTKPEFRLHIKRRKASRLGIAYDELASVLRSYIEGDVLYTLNSGEEEVDVRFTSKESHKSRIEDLLALTVANKDGYLVPISAVVEVERTHKPANIERVNFKRTTMVYADIKPGEKRTPLDIAEQVESDIFAKVAEGIPSATLIFRGEVEDSREAQSDFTLAVLMVIALIYVLLVFLFDSLFTPLIIAAIIPFGVVGTVLAFYAHGMERYGFFAVVGCLGMLGVVINDSTVLVDRLKLRPDLAKLAKGEMKRSVAQISSTRLRAVIVTTVTTVAGLFPTAYGLGGYDSMLAEMMLAMGWGLIFGMFITLLLVPCLYTFYIDLRRFVERGRV